VRDIDDMVALSSRDDSHKHVQDTLSAIRATIVITGGDEKFVSEISELLGNVFIASGLRGFSSVIKGWSKAIRSLLSRNKFDTSNVGYCKLPCNARHDLRLKANCSEEQIDYIVKIYGDLCGIPPIIIHPIYIRVLLPDPCIQDFRNTLPLANIGRCSPPADGTKCEESLKDFFSTTSKQWDWSFDFDHITGQYSKLCTASVPSYSRWESSSKASFDYPRGEGGKMGEVIDKVMNEFMLLTVGDLVPYKPSDDLYDIFGNIVLKLSDYDPGSPIFDSFYKEMSSGEALDDRFGLFGALWAVQDIYERYPDCVESNSEFHIIGYEPPCISFDGTIDSRISIIEEQGWKARITTNTPLSVTIIQVILRHIIDPFVQFDPLVKIGLLSKVKLYDLLVELNGQCRKGIIDDRPSIFWVSVESVDLTTATDSPQRESVNSVLWTFVSKLLPERMEPFYSFALDLAFSARDFGSGTPPHWVHRNGIMMGEALSGVYLNVMSAIVRMCILIFKTRFSDYSGITVSDADEYIRQNQVRIQNWLNNELFTQFQSSSSQSGDDVIIFNYHNPFELSKYLILLYRIFGLQPSESTFYSSEYLGTFAEEFCVRFSTSNGWVFIDMIKPRLFLPGVLRDDLESVLSRISQITGMLKYQWKNLDLIYRVSNLVDDMIALNPVLSDRCWKYGLIKSLPSALGGLDHPIQLDPSWFLDFDQGELDFLVRLSSCTEQEFLLVKYSWAFDEDYLDDDSKFIRETMVLLYKSFNLLEKGDIELGILPLQTYNESELMANSQITGHCAQQRDLNKIKASMGMASLDDIISSVVSSLRFKLRLHGDDMEKTNPMIRLRNRHEFLVSKSKELPDSGGTFEPWMVANISWRLKDTYKNICTQKTEFLQVLGLNNLPMLSIPV